MVGFPGESEKDFEDTLSLVREVGFMSAFTFAYSPRKGTPAANAEQIDDKVKAERLSKLIALQNEVTFALCTKYMGESHRVLVEDYNEKTAMYCGRTDDGKLVNFPLNTNRIGDFVSVKINGSKSSVLFGEVEE
jgi:tRNA-2-methylthio-N6-dimethylallyladenosine synthase